MPNTEWTEAQKLEALMRLPWTIQLSQDDSDGSHIATVEEIPDAIGTGETLERAAHDLCESLKASLSVRLENGDSIATPRSYPLPWIDQQPPADQYAEQSIMR